MQSYHALNNGNRKYNHGESPFSKSPCRGSLEGGASDFPRRPSRAVTFTVFALCLALCLSCVLTARLFRANRELKNSLENSLENSFEKSPSESLEKEGQDSGDACENVTAEKRAESLSSVSEENPTALDMPNNEPVFERYLGALVPSRYMTERICVLLGCIRDMENGNFDSAPDVYGNMAQALYDMLCRDASETKAVQSVCRKYGVTYDGAKLSDSAVKEKKQLDVKYFSQEDSGLPNGCEAVCAAMLLNYYKINVTPEEFADKYLKCEATFVSCGIRYGPNPRKAYSGDPRSASGGIGCYAPVIVDGINKAARGALCAEEISGAPLWRLREYVERGVPVAVWVTVDMGKTERFIKLSSPDGGDICLYPSNEHVMVLVGFDGDDYIFSDPYKSRGTVRYSTEEFLESYNALGRQAVVINS